MRFHCKNCGESMDESLIVSPMLKDYKRKNVPLMAIPCPFCGHGSLEVEE